ncbi:hypothetical protein ILUMI_24731 [Ignelater luminosus]|uniref:HAT C-terminal dimerisation domain-containing protein n=1 Tax=Ignelater luminosus TaxID=2038154 RepID=A0A8K0FWH2_IGNLU|nr:hypothetical protein ILUMI_24731 [Ignelater luminosus]
MSASNSSKSHEDEQHQSCSSAVTVGLEEILQQDPQEILCNPPIIINSPTPDFVTTEDKTISRDPYLWKLNEATRDFIVRMLKARGIAKGRVDKLFVQQLAEEISGLPFRGHLEQFGNPHSGNFSVTVELLAQFDPFLVDHLKSVAHPGSGSVQARIKTINPLADYVSCAARSFNLVETSAAESVSEAVDFFSTLQELYNFFTISTHRWEILMERTKLSLKSLSKTLWSARHDACYALEKEWSGVLDALNFIAERTDEKPSTRSEAIGLQKNNINFFDNLSDKIREETVKVVTKYPNDLEEKALSNECIHLHYYLKQLLESNKNIRSASDISEYLYSHDLCDVYLNVDIALRIYLNIPATSCSGERSFSTLKRVKNYLRARIHQDRLNALALLSIGAQVQEINYEDIIDVFVQKRLCV